MITDPRGSKDIPADIDYAMFLAMACYRYHYDAEFHWRVKAVLRMREHQTNEPVSDHDEIMMMVGLLAADISLTGVNP
jgi:hypothetical protein